MAKHDNRRDVYRSIDIAGRSQAQLAVTGSGADVDDMTGGIYAVWCATAVYIKVHATDSSDVTTLTGFLIPADQILSVKIPDGYHLGGVLAAGSDNLCYFRID